MLFFHTCTHPELGWFRCCDSDRLHLCVCVEGGGTGLVFWGEVLPEEQLEYFRWDVGTHLSH